MYIVCIVFVVIRISPSSPLLSSTKFVSRRFVLLPFSMLCEVCSYRIKNGAYQGEREREREKGEREEKSYKGNIP